MRAFRGGAGKSPATLRGSRLDRNVPNSSWPRCFRPTGASFNGHATRRAARGRHRGDDLAVRHRQGEAGHSERRVRRGARRPSTHAPLGRDQRRPFLGVRPDHHEPALVGRWREPVVSRSGWPRESPAVSRRSERPESHGAHARRTRTSSTTRSPAAKALTLRVRMSSRKSSGRRPIRRRRTSSPEPASRSTSCCIRIRG